MYVLIHYHEIALKGRNRPFFVDKLAQNLRQALADVPATRVQVLAGRLLLDVPEGVSWERIRERVGSVFGVANFGPAHSVPRDLEALSASVIDSLRGLAIDSFRITTKRSDKSFALTSVDLDRRLGGAVQTVTGARVDLDHPQRTVFVEVLRDRFLHSIEKVGGPGGFPVGSSGRVAALLSGGIDSPVAACRLMKRGCKVIFVHFHSFPLLDRTTIDKVETLARDLTRFQFHSRLWLVPFAPVQQAIVAACPTPLRVVLYRRAMVRIAERLALRERAKALVTGESLGQVASQTLDNMVAIDEAATLPILRPLVGMDKDEIVREARRIGTFETSTLPDMDCCQLYVPPHPATAARIDEVQRAERLLDGAALVEAAAGAAELRRFAFPPTTEAAAEAPADDQTL
jgi:thiamine biosynthesis protein ThiI